jgi:hypothetical protein
VAERPLKAADLLGGLRWFDVCAVWQAAKRAAAPYAKQLLRELSISVTTKLSHDSAARKKDPHRKTTVREWTGREDPGRDDWKPASRD